MSAKTLRGVAVCCVAGLIGLLSFPASGFGEGDFQELITTHEKGALRKIVKEAEKKAARKSKDKDALKTLGIAYHNLALLEEKGASKKAVRYLRKASKLMPEDAVVLGYLGSAITLEGRDTINIIKKMGAVNKGTPMMDKAIEMSPDSISLRMLRANNSADLPSNFKRGKFVKIDLMHIAELITKTPGTIAAELQAEVYFKLGNVLVKEGSKKEAEEYFKKAQESAPKSEWGKKAKKML